MVEAMPAAQCLETARRALGAAAAALAWVPMAEPDRPVPYQPHLREALVATARALDAVVAAQKAGPC